MIKNLSGAKTSQSRRRFIKNLAMVSAVGTVPSISLSCQKTNKSSATNYYDTVIYGATPGGVACAVRLVREGLKVLLVSYNQKIGGMLTSGLGVWDTLYEGYRSPIYNELRQTFFDHYRNTYGENSQEFIDASPGESGHNNGTFEAHVAEKYITALVTNEPNITFLANHYPVSVEIEHRKICSVQLQEMDKDNTKRFSAKYFVDCSYEGDLMAVAKVEYRVGRESKDEYNEKHAGEIYMDPQGESEWSEREEKIFTSLNFRHFGHHQNIIYPHSTHKGDHKVQAYNMRYYGTSDPNNQIELKPSSEYDPEFLKTLEFGHTDPVKPNNKCGINRPQLVGFHNQYVEGDWPTRRKVIDEHVRVTRDMLYFIQNDPQAPARLKEIWKGWGLAKDEYVDNNNNPYEIYVREARRMVGKHVYTENDLALHVDYDRTPIFHDSIGFIEWYQDCHACTFVKVPGSLHEGKMMIHKETFIGQFPYRSILPKGLDNFLVPVCVSSTHVSWGAIRLEPTWMQLGESAALAILQSNQEDIPLPEINTKKLTRKIAESKSMVSFFNDFYVDDEDEWIPAVQFFGTQGFFPSYFAYPTEPLDEQTAQVWIESVRQMINNQHDPEVTAKRLNNHEPGAPINSDAFNKLLQEHAIDYQVNGDRAIISRSEACLHLYQLI